MECTLRACFAYRLFPKSFGFLGSVNDTLLSVYDWHWLFSLEIFIAFDNQVPGIYCPLDDLHIWAEGGYPWGKSGQMLKSNFKSIPKSVTFKGCPKMDCHYFTLIVAFVPQQQRSVRLLVLRCRAGLSIPVETRPLATKVLLIAQTYSVKISAGSDRPRFLQCGSSEQVAPKSIVFFCYISKFV